MRLKCSNTLASGIKVYWDDGQVTLQHFSGDGSYSSHLKLTRAQALELAKALETAWLQLAEAT